MVRFSICISILIPSLEKYDLKYLVETFIHPKILESEITKRCYPNAKTLILFDAVCILANQKTF